MPTLGSELKRQREERGITLSQISEGTRIGTRFLKAIEEDNFAVLPGGIFTRSFIRAYAKHVGMNDEEAIDRYHQQIAPPVDETLDTPPPPSKLESIPSVQDLLGQTATRARWTTIVVAAGTFVLISIVVVAMVNRLNRTDVEQAAKTSGPPSRPSAQTSASRSNT